ncbi:kinase-like domain-containing protein, partial [Dunaliella salina]
MEELQATLEISRWCKRVVQCKGWTKMGAAESPCLIMAFYEHGTLQQLILEGSQGRPRDSDGPEDKLPLQIILRISKDVGLGISELHRGGMVNEDLKPSNVFLDGENHAVLADFGMSKFFGCAHEESMLSTKNVRGTGPFLAPEKLSDDASCTYSSPADMWSFGILLGQMVTVDMFYPYGRRITWRNVQNQLVKEKKPPSAPSIPEAPGLEQLIQSCLQLDPARRPTADEAVQVLECMEQQMQPSTNTHTPSAPLVAQQLSLANQEDNNLPPLCQPHNWEERYKSQGTELLQPVGKDFKKLRPKRVAVVGRSGTGKSSLINCLMRRHAASVDLARTCTVHASEPLPLTDDLELMDFPGYDCMPERRPTLLESVGRFIGWKGVMKPVAVEGSCSATNFLRYYIGVLQDSDAILCVLGRRCPPVTWELVKKLVDLGKVVYLVATNCGFELDEMGYFEPKGQMEREELRQEYLNMCSMPFRLVAEQMPFFCVHVPWPSRPASQRAIEMRLEANCSRFDFPALRTFLENLRTSTPEAPHPLALLAMGLALRCAPVL